MRVCNSRDRLREVCSDATWTWPGVYKEHPGYRPDDAERSVVVITGTLNFFDVMARHTWPLGRLGHKRSFWTRPENLQIFLRALSQLAGGHILFLYGGSGSVSEVESVTGTLISGLLRYS